MDVVINHASTVDFASLGMHMNFALRRTSIHALSYARGASHNL